MREGNSIGLTAAEQALYDSISWNDDLSTNEPAASQTALLEHVGQLAESLILRGAIPPVRLEWFSNPKWNVGRRWRSRQAAIESAGVQGRDVYRHRDFVNCLWYFIHGPRLPETTIKGFVLIVQEHAGAAEELRKRACAFVRGEVQRRRLHGSGEEFLKLALECGQEELALAMRLTAMTQEKRHRRSPRGHERR